MERPDRPRGRADYGLDAPGLVKGFGALAVACTALGIVTRTVEVPWPPALTSWLVWPGASFGATAAFMVWSSYLGKMRARDLLLDALELAGAETVLDIGCGRGLLLLGAAKRLVNGGRAIGVDIWSDKDLSANSRDATLRNAELEGVRDRVEVVDCDMRKLSLDAASVDVVISCFAIHNVESRDERRKAIREIARVLRPGGKVALQDLQFTGQYAEDLAEAGLVGVGVDGPTLNTFPPSWVVRGRKRA